MKRYITYFLLLYVLTNTHAQIRISGESNTLAGFGSRSAFWIQNNSMGQFSRDNFQQNIILDIRRDINPENKIFDVGVGVKGLAGLTNSGYRLIPMEYYITGKLWIFDAIIGAKQQHFGLQSEDLSSGGFLHSNNALPLPGITAGIFEFTPIPLTDKRLEIKGLVRHGWFVDNTYGENILLHHKHATMRFGGDWPVRFSYGLDHAAQWGGTLPRLGQQPESLSDFYRIFLGKGGGSDADLGDQINALGNHIISQQLNLDVRIKNWTALFYWHNLSEDGPIRWPWLAMNWRDGLWGVRLNDANGSWIKEMTFEFMNTLDNSGPWHDKDGIVFGGADSYFTNFADWAFYGRTIGNPFILSPVYNQPDNIKIKYNHFKAFHAGIKGNAFKFDYRILASQVRYYPDMKVPVYNDHFFGLIELSRNFGTKFPFTGSVSVAGDLGIITGNNLSVMVGVKKELEVKRGF